MCSNSPRTTNLTTPCSIHMRSGWVPAGRQVRAAVRALTLNVYGIADEAVQRFLCSPPASAYFTDLAMLITEQCQARASYPQSMPLLSIEVPARSWYVWAPM